MLLRLSVRDDEISRPAEREEELEDEHRNPRREYGGGRRLCEIIAAMGVIPGLTKERPREFVARSLALCTLRIQWRDAGEVFLTRAAAGPRPTTPFILFLSAATLRPSPAF